LITRFACSGEERLSLFLPCMNRFPLAVGPVGMWAKASIPPGFPRRLAGHRGLRETWGKRSRSAKPIVHISTGRRRLHRAEFGSSAPDGVSVGAEEPILPRRCTASWPAPWTVRSAGRHGRDRWMGRSAAPCRSARLRGDGALLVDEGDHFLNGRAISAWAKYADILRRLSFVWRSSRTSRTSALIHSYSSV
jgi:hypothetical protein